MAQVNRSILKALETLEVLAQASDGMTLSDLSVQAGYPISTAHRLLASLQQLGYVEQDPATRRYFLGVKILTLQSQGIRRHHFVRYAFPHLSRLKQELSETINIGILSGKDVVYLETYSPDTSMSFYAPPGTRMPSYCTAMGKLLLSHLPPDAFDDLLSSITFSACTPNTITSHSDLKTELQQIRHRGYALDNEEYALGVRCVAAPIRDHRGTVIAGVSVTVLAERLNTESVERIATQLVQACDRISEALGYKTK
jgi:IclR family KDG regulon transcriptional repressor